METAFWLMIAVVGTAFFAFISVVVWLGTREKEREAHYRGETARRIAEADDAGSVLEYVRETERIDTERTRLKARLITMAVGVALMIFLYQAMPGSPGYLVGLIPLFVGMVLLLLSEVLMKPPAD
jgi:Mg2+/citrate symporter